MNGIKEHYQSDMFTIFGALWIMLYYASLPKWLADAVLPWLETHALPSKQAREWLDKYFKPEIVPIVSNL